MQQDLPLFSHTPTLRIPFLGYRASFLILLLSVLFTGFSFAGNPDGDLEIKLLSGSNLVISPDGSGPNLVYIGAEITNNGQNTLSDLSLSIGDFDLNTPGLYPSRSHSGLSGSLSLKHVNTAGNYSDANRYIGKLEPGNSVVQYWLVEYPKTDDAGNTVSLTDALDDDLWLEYDIWASANDAGQSLLANTSQSLHCREEGSKANSQAWSIEDENLPTRYTDLLQSINLWDVNDNTSAIAGESLVIPVWHQLGSVKFGLDNDLDLVPDFNALVQPVGNLNSFDPSCFRLVKTYGVLLIEDEDENISFISFENQIHFENIIRTNDAVMALVNYEFVALGADCSSSLSPYQSVASSLNAESYNQNFGLPVGSLTAVNHPYSITVNQESSITKGTDLSLQYQVSSTNNSGLGKPEIAAGLSLYTKIPTGTAFVGGSAASDLVTLFSIDGGVNWQSKEPTDASSITDLLWLLKDEITDSQKPIVSYKLNIPSGYSDDIVMPSMSVQIQGGIALTSVNSTITVAGERSLSGTLFADTGSSQDFANGQQENGENGIPNIKLALFLDANADGDLDVDEPQIGEQITNSVGQYEFKSLPDAKYILAIDADSSLVSEAWYPTSSPLFNPVSLVANSESNLNLGMSPLLVHAQNLMNSVPALEGQLLRYEISLTHMIDGSSVDLSSALWTETYNPLQMELVSANPAPTSTDLSNGILEWTNISAINAGENQSIELVFRPAATNYTQDYIIQLISNVENLQFTDENNLEILSDTLNQIITPSGSISGYIWNDYSGSVAGWSNSLGFEGADGFLPNIQVFAFTCVASSGERLTITTANTNNPCEGGSNKGSWVKIDSALTKADGSYHFTGIGDGYFYVAVDQSSISNLSTAKGDPDESGLCVDCDAIWGDPNMALRDIDAIDAQTDIQNINFGFNLMPGVAGYIWHDIDANGLFDASEAGIASFPLELVSSDCSSGVDCPTTNTNADGYYEFTNLVNNQTYSIKPGVHASSNTYTFLQTAESDGSLNQLIEKTISNGQWQYEQNFAYQMQGTASLSINVLADWNANFIKDIADEGINNVSVKLYFDADEDGLFDLNNDPYVKSAQTDLQGLVSFDHLMYGTYFYQLQNLNHPVLAQTKMIADPDESNGSNCTQCDGIATAVLSSLKPNITQNWAFEPIGTLAVEGLVWEDLNADQAAQTLTEQAIADISVMLEVDLNEDGNYVALSTLQSDVEGRFRFAELIEGAYKIKVDVQDADLPQGTNGTSYAITGSDEIIANLTNGILTLNTQSDDVARFGFNQLASIGDIVFWDYDGDGQRDPLEEGIAGVEVCLCEGEVSPCTRTNALKSVVTSYGTNGEEIGSYKFEDLLPATYTISVQSSSQPISNATQTASPAAFGETCTSGCNSSYNLVLNYGLHYQGINFGYEAQGVMGGNIYLDLNKNGQMDEGEQGLANQTVALIPPSRVDIGGGRGRAVIKTTDESGSYIYDNLPDGFYRLSAKAPVGYILTNDGDGDINGIAYIYIRSGQVAAYGRTYCTDCSMDANIGLRVGGYYSIEGKICLDDPTIDGSCNNGSLDTPLGGISVILSQSDGTYLGSIETEDDGTYSFPNLNVGTYNVTISKVDFPISIASLSTDANTSVASQVIDGTSQSTLQVVLGSSNLNSVDFAYDLAVDLDLGSLPVNYFERTGFAYHIIDENNELYLGQEVQSQTASLSSLSGFISDNNEVSSSVDDGIVFLDLSTWEEGSVADNKGGSVQADISAAGWLVAWIDFNQDQDFLDQGEMIINTAAAAGSQTFAFSIPMGTSLDQTYYSRFRLFESEPIIPPTSFSGGVLSGEVEDYGIDFTSLPVELLSFEAALTDFGVDLEWVTASELNTQRFDVERSVDGLLFRKISETAAVGNSSELQFYNTTDNEIRNIGLVQLYYRLKMVDIDGTFSYSEIKSVVIADEVSISLMLAPSPPIDVLKAEFMAQANETVKLSIVNGVGQTLWSESIIAQGGVNFWQRSVVEYPAGVYYLRLSHEREVRVVKFLKN